MEGNTIPGKTTEEQLEILDECIEAVGKDLDERERVQQEPKQTTEAAIVEKAMDQVAELVEEKHDLQRDNDDLKQRIHDDHVTQALTPERTSFPQIDEQDLLDGIQNTRPPLELQHPAIAAFVAQIKAQTNVCDWTAAKDIDIVLFALQFLSASGSHPQVAALVLEFAEALRQERRVMIAEAVKGVAEK